MLWIRRRQAKITISKQDVVSAFTNTVFCCYNSSSTHQDWTSKLKAQYVKMPKVINCQHIKTTLPEPKALATIQDIWSGINNGVQDQFPNYSTTRGREPVVDTTSRAHKYSRAQKLRPYKSCPLGRHNSNLTKSRSSIQGQEGNKKIAAPHIQIVLKNNLKPSLKALSMRQRQQDYQQKVGDQA